MRIKMLRGQSLGSKANEVIKKFGGWQGMLRKKVLEIFAKQNGNIEMETLSFLPLRPEYSAESHKIYVDVLNDTLKNKDIHNIAVAGHYGVGKSSILSKVADENKTLGVISISLSSVCGEANGAEILQTDQIQKEIVKQLLYRETPSKTPGSRYKRLGQYDQVSEVWGIGSLALLIFTGLFFTVQIQEHIIFRELDDWLIILTGMEVYLVLLVCLLILRRITFGRISFDKFTAGPATITLTKTEGEYFDLFLDELIYFFEVTKAQVVIFEDLDRFNNPTIFDNLKTLNSLLNTAGQLQGRSIRFIYAIRDSIFESAGETTTGHIKPPSNRTKFFDLVVPVVPFITHNSARDLMTTIMGVIDHKVPDKLVRIAARHVTDMRMLKNVRNEFLIFRNKILERDDLKSTLGLNEGNLFAMILYKNTHLEDFEKISTGESQLDLLYEKSRLVVNEEINRLTGDEVETNSRVASWNSIVSQCESLGTKFFKVLNRLQSLLKSSTMTMVLRTVDWESMEVDSEKLKCESTWTSIITSSAKLEVTFIISNTTQTVSIGAEDVEILLGEPLVVDDWQKKNLRALEEQVRTIRSKVEEWRKADFADLMRHNPKVPGLEGSFEDFLKDCLKSELARDLVRNGFIDRNFTLYTSVYHDVHVSVSAKNFLMKCIAKQEMDAEFTLEEEDIESVLSEISEEDLALPGAYNINLLDFFLVTDNPRGDTLLNALARLGNQEHIFLEKYWLRGNQQLKLAEKLSRLTPNILIYLITDKTVPANFVNPKQVEKETE